MVVILVFVLHSIKTIESCLLSGGRIEQQGGSGGIALME
jgi:hypothetical protein